MSIFNELGSLRPTPAMPLLFLGHGSPMNAIEENQFVKGFRNISLTLPEPAAILCISAHWETKGTHVTINDKPRTIHDFSGFPRELYDVQYNAPGSQSLAGEVKNTVKSTDIVPSTDWGLDHGAWSVIRHLYPGATVPVVQMSLDYNATPESHYNIASELKSLREKGVIIIGSGNIVHNLSMIDWRRLNDYDYGFDWAKEADSKIRAMISSGDHRELINITNHGGIYKLAIPTPEHYLPLLYVLGLSDKNDNISFFNDKAVGGSLTMTSVKIERP